ncbi:MAG: FAD-dependent oxidoreductase [Anaerolineales bacterium]|nr:FAD-dependent oxidoreductase [Anaerolineales bacterium]
MTQVGTASQPLRVAILGSGPAAFYAAEHFFKQPDLVVEVDMFDRLNTPFGLVRHGVAPDHPKIKTVTKAFDAIAANPRFRFFGHVEFGKHLTLADLQLHYHQVLFATGAQTDRRMGIPGEDLAGSHPATEFVAWYNGHPDYRHHPFDLSVERAAVVGVGNVAIDVARILVRTPDELVKTDIAAHALEALRHSRIKEVYLLGRRGPVQAAFTNPEVKEVGEMADADVVVRPDEVQLDDLSRAHLEASQDRTLNKKVEILQGYALRKAEGKSKKLHIRFLVSPVELIGDAEGRVAKMRLVRNVLVAADTGTLNAKATDQFEELEVGLVFRSVGYRGVALPGVPFHDRWGVILNDKGRVLDPDTKHPLVGQYTSGWIKRGPSGVIGTNKPDSVETVTSMLEDLAQGAHFQPAQPQAEAAEALVRARQPLYVTYAEWRRLDALELSNGQAAGRPRLKFTAGDEMLAALGKAVPTP